MDLSEIMTSDVVVCSPNDTLAQVALRMQSEDIGCCPVVEEGTLVGMITDRDITIRSAARGFDPNQQQVREVMTTNIIGAYPSMSVEDACRLMSDNQIRRLPVLEDDQLVGMVSLADLAIDFEEAEMLAETLESISEPAR